jgi:hypothetical protein
VTDLQRTEPPAARNDDPADRRAELDRGRGRVSVYAVAFLLMLVGGALLAVSTLGKLHSIGLLQVSAAFSVAAIVAAVVAVVLPRR